MNLLIPQKICKQTKNPDDGFIFGATTGSLRFANHQRTIYYNPKNNLPIFLHHLHLLLDHFLPYHLPAQTPVLKPY
jgi:hypothetical protein